MLIQNIKSGNTSFGLLHFYLLSDRHKKLINPIFPKLANIGKKVDITASTRVRPEVIGGDYMILTECLELVSKPKVNSKNPGQTAIERIFTNKYINANESKLKMAHDEILSAAYRAAKKSLTPRTLNA